MRTFVLLSTLSNQGMRTLAATPERLLEVNREIEAFGGRVVRQWALLGDYDMMTVVEAPDEAAMARISVELGSRGGARFDSLVAMRVEELFEDAPPERGP